MPCWRPTVGARLIGKANLHELAMLPVGTNPWFGTPVNPWCPRSSTGPDMCRCSTRQDFRAPPSRSPPPGLGSVSLQLVGPLDSEELLSPTAQRVEAAVS